MASLNSLRTDVRLNAVAIPDVVIDRALWRTARDFLTRTELYTSELSAPMPYTLNAVAYDPTALIPAGYELNRIMSVRWLPAPQTIPFKTKEQLTAQYPNWETLVGNGPSSGGTSYSATNVPYFWTMMTPNIVRIYPIAGLTVASALSMTVSLTIPENTATIPDWLYRQHSNDIQAGAEAILFSMPKKEWSDKGYAMGRSQQYEEAVKTAIAQAGAGFGRPSYSTSYGGI